MNLKVKTNVPEIITFKFDTWKKWENTSKDGSPYSTYSIGVENRGESMYFSVYEREYTHIFSKLGNLKDRTLTVEKYEDGKYKNWRILEDGKDITPSYTTQAQKTSPSANSELTERLDKADKAFKELEERVESLEAKVASLEVDKIPY